MFWIALILAVFPQVKVDKVCFENKERRAVLSTQTPFREETEQKHKINDLVREESSLAKARFPFHSKQQENLILPDIENINWDNVLRKGDLVVGLFNPHETLHVHNDTTWWHFGNVYIINHGVMLIENAEFRNYGDIGIFGHGKLLVDSSDFGFLPIYWWQFMFGGFDSSEVRIENSHFCYSLPILTGGFDNCQLSFINMQFDTWLSGYFYDNAGITIDNCHGLTGEYCMMDSATGSITVTNSDTVAIWLSFFNGSVIDFTTFYEEFVEHWKFPENVGATGIPYSVTIDSSYLRNTSVMLYSGSDVTLQDSYTPVRIRATRTDSLTISGLMDSTYHTNWEFPFSDRYLHLLNTTTWHYSIYAVDSSRVWLDSSRVSEIVCSQNSSFYMNNSINNGGAGCFWVWDNSTAYVSNSLTQTETIVRGTSKLTMYNSSIEDHIWGPGNLIVEDSGVVFLLNSKTQRKPKLYDKSVLYYASIDSPAVASCTDSVPIYGSAYINGGPDCDISFSSYQLYYADSLNPDSLIPITSEYTDTIRDSILDYWNTSSLAEGTYTLYLRLKDSFGDSVQTYWSIYVSGIGIEEKQLQPESFSLSVTPNPLNSITNIKYSISVSSDIELSIYNICGQEIATLDKGIKKAGEYWVVWNTENFSNGVYFCRLKANDKLLLTKKLLLLR